MSIWEKLHSGELYQSADEELLREQERYLDRLYAFNHTRPAEQDRRTAILRELLAEFGEGSYIEPPFHANWGGHHLHIGKNVYANFNRASGTGLSVQRAHSDRQGLLAGGRRDCSALRQHWGRNGHRGGKRRHPGYSAGFPGRGKSVQSSARAGRA